MISLLAYFNRFDREPRGAIFAGLFVAFWLLGGCLVLFRSTPSMATVTASNVRVDEAAGVATFTFTEDNSDTSTVSIYYSTENGSAIGSATTGSGDYTETSGIRLPVPFGEKVYVSVPINDDSEVESTEDFYLNVSFNERQPNATYTAFIVDNDKAVTPPPVTPPPVAPPVTPPPHTPPVAQPVTPPPVTPVEDPTPPPPTPPATEGIQPFKPVDVAIPTYDPKGPSVSAFVLAVKSPSELKLSAWTLIRNLILAGLLVLLILFPAELFNSALASNYDEVSGWFKLRRTRRALGWIKRLPSTLTLIFFAALGAALNSQLSPGLGLDPASLSLVLGMFITLFLTSTLYDLTRAVYMKRRFGIEGKLRTHMIGLLVGGVLVLLSRLVHFLPGYLYGIFTALVFSRKAPTDKQDGEGLAVASLLLLVVGVICWLALSPIKAAASAPGAGFWLLVLNATLASMWVTALIAMVFGLAPIRFFYGEQVKKWNRFGWSILYTLGAALFIFAILDPNQSLYGKSNQTTMGAVLTLFVGFGLFSVIFWGYFRYRHIWRHVPDSNEIADLH